jgi:hypothetical protein
MCAPPALTLFLATFILLPHEVLFRGSESLFIAVPLALDILVD